MAQVTVRVETEVKDFEYAIWPKGAVAGAVVLGKKIKTFPLPAGDYLGAWLARGAAGSDFALRVTTSAAELFSIESMLTQAGTDSGPIDFTVS